MLNILFIADVIGSPGRDVVRALLPELRRRHDARTWWSATARTRPAASA